VSSGKACLTTVALLWSPSKQLSSKLAWKSVRLLRTKLEDRIKYCGYHGQWRMLRRGAPRDRMSTFQTVPIRKKMIRIISMRFAAKCDCPLQSVVRIEK